MSITKPLCKNIESVLYCWPLCLHLFCAFQTHLICSLSCLPTTPPAWRVGRPHIYWQWQSDHITWVVPHMASRKRNITCVPSGNYLETKRSLLYGSPADRHFVYQLMFCITSLNVKYKKYRFHCFWKGLELVEMGYWGVNFWLISCWMKTFHWRNIPHAIRWNYHSCCQDTTEGYNTNSGCSSMQLLN